MKKLIIALVAAASLAPVNVSAKSYAVSEIKSDTFNVKYSYNKDGTLKSFVADAGWKAKTSFHYAKGHISYKNAPNGKTTYTYRNGRVIKAKNRNENDTYVYSKNKITIKSVSKGGIHAEEYIKVKNGKLIEHNGTKYQYDKKGYLKSCGTNGAVSKYSNSYKNGRLTKVKETVMSYTPVKTTYTIKYKAVSRLSSEAKKQQNAILGKSYLPYLSRFR